MLNEQTISTMQQLKLFGMVKGFEERLGSPQHAELSHADFVGFLIQDEKTYRENRRFKRLLQNAKLKQQQACLEDANYRHPRGLSKQAILELSNTEWINAHRNVLISGPTGIGKTWLACALGNFAARAGYTILYARAPRLFTSLAQARGDGSHLKTLAKLAKIQLLILDDLFITPLSDENRKDLLEIVEDRYAESSTVISSQYATKDWHHCINEPTLADAICDRVLHNAYKLEFNKGRSIRKENAERKNPS